MATPPTSKRDPKQEAAGRAEADQEARNALAAVLAAERRARLTAGSRDAITDDASLICGRIACGASIKTVAGELSVAADVLAAWLLHPDRVEQYRTALLAAGHMFATEAVEIADDIRLPAPDRKVMVDARWQAARTMGRDWYADKVQVEHTGTVDMAVALDAAAARVRRALAGPVMDAEIVSVAHAMSATVPTP